MSPPLCMVCRFTASYPQGYTHQAILVIVSVNRCYPHYPQHYYYDDEVNSY